MPNGMTPESMIDRIYTELVGLDGKSGMVKQVAEDHERIGQLERTSVSKEECAVTRKHAGDRRDKVLLRVKDVLLVILAVATLLLGSGILQK